MPNTPVTLPPAEFDRLRAEYEADGEVMPDHYIRAIPIEASAFTAARAIVSSDLSSLANVKLPQSAHNIRLVSIPTEQRGYELWGKADE
jgi:hypothetical protein